eukprot:g3541.t1
MGSPFKNGISPYKNVKSKVMTSVPERMKAPRSVTAPTGRSAAHVHKILKERKLKTRLKRVVPKKDKKTLNREQNNIVVSSRTGRRIRILSSTRENTFPSGGERTLQRVREILSRRSDSKKRDNVTSSWQVETQWMLNSLRETKNRPVSSSFLDRPRATIRRTLSIGLENRKIRVILRLQEDEFENQCVNVEADDDSINCLYTLKIVPPSDHDMTKRNNNNDEDGKKSIELLERVAKSLSICDYSDKSPGHLVSDLADSSSTRILNPESELWSSKSDHSLSHTASDIVRVTKTTRPNVLSIQVKRKLIPVFCTRKSEKSGGEEDFGRTPPVLLAAFSVIHGELKFCDVKVDGMDETICRLEKMCEDMNDGGGIINIREFLESLPKALMAFLQGEGLFTTR